MKDVLTHHGILGMKWGVRNGPPYPLGGGDYSPTEQREIRKARKGANSIYNKRHFDEILSREKTILRTLSYDPTRTKNTDMFYATHNALDKHQYNALFNRKIDQPIYDNKGNQIGTGSFLKYRIDNALTRDIKVASEDSGAKLFSELYKKNRNFYNFVTDSDRMQSYFVSDKYKFKGYREARDALTQLRKPGYVPTQSELQKVYRMFNYVIPYDGGGDERKERDMKRIRAEFFKVVKDAGYGAILDTNDAIYGGFKATSPVIVIDMESIIPKSVRRTTTASKEFSSLVSVGRKFLGV